MRFFEYFWVKLVLLLAFLTLPYILALAVFDQQDPWGRALLAVYTLFGMVVGDIIYLFFYSVFKDNEQERKLFWFGFAYIVFLTSLYAELHLK